ncbi:MAG: hypothetical protein AW07_01362 [Candidatus Accumulibacter sp. SK-11]|nr:MAG: hypothetical protein AW07_01362 [Candidatus Accumulibacter sp. SK-11]
MPVEVAQVDVGAGDAADERQDDAAPSFLAGQQSRPRRFGLAPDASPDVDLPTGVEHDVVGVEGIVLPGAEDDCGDVALSAGVGAGADLREEARANEAVIAGELLDAGGRDHQILVLAQRRRHQVVEHRIGELFPPGGIGEVAGVLLTEAPGRRCVERRANVVGSDHAAAGEQRQQGHEQWLTHGRPPPFQGAWWTFRPCRPPPRRSRDCAHRLLPCD